MNDDKALPPPGEVFELSEKAVDFVRRVLGIGLDYTAETLPLLDHYLGEVPRDQPATVELVATTAGAYFGETARKTLGGVWENLGSPPGAWIVRLTGDVSFSPVDAVLEAIAVGAVEGHDGGFDVSPGDRDAVEAALEHLSVPEEEFYSLSGRLEALTTVVNAVVALRATRS